MTFNYHKDIELPSNIQTGGNMWNTNPIIMEKPLPFIHMFRYNRGEHYNILYNRLINMI